MFSTLAWRERVMHVCVLTKCSVTAQSLHKPQGRGSGDSNEPGDQASETLELATQLLFTAEGPALFHYWLDLHGHLKRSLTSFRVRRFTKQWIKLIQALRLQAIRPLIFKTNSAENWWILFMTMKNLFIKIKIETHKPVPLKPFCRSHSKPWSSER